MSSKIQTYPTFVYLAKGYINMTTEYIDIAPVGELPDDESDDTSRNSGSDNNDSVSFDTKTVPNVENVTDFKILKEMLQIFEETGIDAGLVDYRGNKMDAGTRDVLVHIVDNFQDQYSE